MGSYQKDGCYGRQWREWSREWDKACAFTHIYRSLHVYAMVENFHMGEIDTGDTDNRDRSSRGACISIYGRERSRNAKTPKITQKRKNNSKQAAKYSSSQAK